MKKKRKSPSVDAFVRFFLQHYNIPTKQDIEKLTNRLERLEVALKAHGTAGRKTKKARAVTGAARNKQPRKARAKMTATEKILSIIEGSAGGSDIASLKAKTGFGDKKIRNIVFRLTKQGTLRRAGRGVYTVQ